MLKRIGAAIVAAALIAVVVYLGWLSNGDSTYVWWFGLAAALGAPTGLTFLGFALKGSDSDLISKLAKVPEIERLIDEAKNHEEKIRLLEAEQQKLVDIVRLESRRQAITERVSSLEGDAARILIELENLDQEQRYLGITIGNSNVSDEIARLRERIRARERGDLVIQIGDSEQNNDLQLVFDEADVRELDSFAERMRAALPGIIQSVIVKGADELLRALQRNWEAHYAIECVQIDDFEKRLDDCWGVGLNLLRLLLAIARGMGSDAERRFRRSKSDAHRYRRFALIRLHARACQVSDEIITLMQSGFADGAMARWRTIHEIGVVETLIEDGNEDLAKRYIDHNVVEVKKQADDWNDKQVSLGHAPIGRRQRQSIEKAYASAIGRYGQNFRHDYGWAAKYLGETRPDFKRLQMAADQSEMNTYYKLANFNVHAGARGMFFRLSDVGGANLQLAGRSNAGLLEPGRNTAYTLVRVTGTLLGQPRSVDRLVEIKTLITIRDAISPALERADRKLRNDEAKMRHDRKRRRKQ